MQAEQQRLKAADSIVVIGGGPVGVEVAAEILTDLPGVQLGPLPNACQMSNIRSLRKARVSS